MQKTSTPGFYSQCLRYLLWLRLFALGAQVAVLVVLHLSRQLVLPVTPAFSVVAGMGLITLWCFYYLQRGKVINELFFFFQLVIDVTALTVFLYFTGGATNPFAPLFLLPVVISAATLPARNTWLIAAIAAVGYTGLMFFHVPLHIHGVAENDFKIHIWGMWIGFLLAAVLVAYFVSQIGATLKRHDRELARARETALRNEQILALGTLAAGTAHELGTPLSTMAVIAKELENINDENSELVQDLKLLREQIDRCKSILARMASDAGQLQADSGRCMPIDQYLQELITDWSVTHPDRVVSAGYDGETPAPSIIADRTLTQAIINILDNAAEVSKETLNMNVSWNNEELCISVRDHGPGLEPEIAQKIGQPFNTTKQPENGMGLGLFLAHTTLDRLGGRLQLANANDGGNMAEIILPLNSMLAEG